MKRFLKKSLSLALISLIAGACGHAKKESQLKIINGTMGWFSEQPSVVLIYDSKYETFCTGTFISDNEVLTAAHCTENFRADTNGFVKGTMQLLQVDVDFDGGRESKVVAESTRIVRDPRWEKYGAGVNNFDLAIVSFPENTWGTHSKISKRHARRGDAVEMFGYGSDQDVGSRPSKMAAFRKGYNVIEQVKGGFIVFPGYPSTPRFEGDGSFASAGQGDSGGPLFVNGELVGVVSGGVSPNEDSDYVYNYYVDLQTIEAQSFLEFALQK